VPKNLDQARGGSDQAGDGGDQGGDCRDDGGDFHAAIMPSRHPAADKSPSIPDHIAAQASLDGPPPRV
jgi:hypothetical protein